MQQLHYHILTSHGRYSTVLVLLLVAHLDRAAIRGRLDDAERPLAVRQVRLQGAHVEELLSASSGPPAGAGALPSRHGGARQRPGGPLQGQCNRGSRALMGSKQLSEPFLLQHHNVCAEQRKSSLQCSVWCSVRCSVQCSVHCSPTVLQYHCILCSVQCAMQCAVQCAVQRTLQYP